MTFNLRASRFGQVASRELLHFEQGRARPARATGLPEQSEHRYQFIPGFFGSEIAHRGSTFS
ncbi:MAG: hypothetical protein WDO68_31145 [Gammaproteobacteria bacterium]